MSISQGFPSQFSDSESSDGDGSDSQPGLKHGYVRGPTFTRIDPSPSLPENPPSRSPGSSFTLLSLSLVPSPLPSSEIHSRHEPPLSGPQPSSSNSQVQGGLQVVDAKGEQEGRSKQEGASIKRKGSEKKKVKGPWFPLTDPGEGNAVMVGGLLVSQLPEPGTEEEREEQKREWEEGETSEGEIERAYEFLQKLNKNELKDHHHEFPSPLVFQKHYPCLPQWARQGGRPKWRSPLDQELAASPETKLWRYVYTWWFELPLEEAERFEAEIGREKWEETAKKGGWTAAFSTMRDGVRREIRKARETESSTVDLFRYVGMGAGSEFQLNSSCRAFNHVHGLKSLFGLALAIIRSFQSSNPSSTAHLFQPFLISLPFDSFPFSSHIFMYAETIFAVLLQASPVCGGANVASCGDLDLLSALRQHLETIRSFNLDPSAPLSTILDLEPISLSLILHDRSVGKGWTTVGEIGEDGFEGSKRAWIEEVEGMEEGDLAERVAARNRRERIKKREMELRENEREKFGIPIASPSSSRTSPSIRQIAPSTISLYTPPPMSSSPPSTQLQGNTKEVQLARLRVKHKINTLDHAQLDSLVGSLPYSPNNISVLLSCLHSSSLNLRVKQEVVLHLLYRVQTTGGVRRESDNLLTKASLMSALGVRVSGSVAVWETGQVSLGLSGIGVDVGREQVTEWALDQVVLLPEGRKELVLKLEGNSEMLGFYESDGRTPVQVRPRGRPGGQGVCNVVWLRVRASENTKRAGLAKILGWE